MKCVFNINDKMIVRLTPAGEKAWNESWITNHGQVPESIRKHATLPDGRVEFQIWDAMHIFGPLCYNGSLKLPFVNNEVEFQ